MENEKHFRLLKDDSIEIDGVKLYRIEATKDLPQHDVEKGDLGGYVEDECNLSGNAWVGRNAEVFGNACVSGETEVRYGVCLTDKAYVKNNEDFCFFYGFGRTNRRTTFFKTKEGNIFVVCGCFEGTLEKFVEQVKETHGDNKFAKEYLSIVEVVKIKFDLQNI